MSYCSVDRIKIDIMWHSYQFVSFSSRSLQLNDIWCWSEHQSYLIKIWWHDEDVFVSRVALVRDLLMLSWGSTFSIARVSELVSFLECLFLIKSNHRDYYLDKYSSVDWFTGIWLVVVAVVFSFFPRVVLTNRNWFLVPIDRELSRTRERGKKMRRRGRCHLFYALFALSLFSFEADEENKRQAVTNTIFSPVSLLIKYVSLNVWMLCLFCAARRRIYLALARISFQLDCADLLTGLLSRFICHVFRRRRRPNTNAMIECLYFCQTHHRWPVN